VSVKLQDKNQYWSEHFAGLDVSGEAIAATEFDGCSFTECNFSDAAFKRCNFVDCEFLRCNLSLATVDYCRFSDVRFRDSKLIGIDWTKVSWSQFGFSPLKFFKCLVNDANFYGLALPEIVFEECRAHNVDFREADLSKASFCYTDLSGSLFARTNLSGADFSEATDYDIDIYQNTIKGARFSRFEALRLLDCLDIELVD
jgi:uncharacterized protein YjbI with pentapeptide repeats